MVDRKDNSLFFRNTSGISIVEFFWGLGLPLVFESTFLQLFLSKLGASNVIIGLIPTVFFIGQALFGVVAAYQTRKIVKTRSIVILYHIYPALIILGFGIYLLITGTFLPSTIVVFFLSYMIFNAGIGMILPIWQNYIVKIFKNSQVLPAFSIMMLLQSAGRLISSFLIAGFFTGKEITASNSAVMFIFCGLAFLIGAFGFFITREPEFPGPTRDSDSGFIKYIFAAFKRIIENRNMIFFLLSDIEMYAVIAVLSFYANYAVGYHGISEAAAAGLFVGLNYAGQITANITLGTLNLFSMKTKCILSRIFSITAIILLIIGSSLPVFLTVSILFGFSRAVRSLVYAPAVKKMSGRKNVTDYYAAIPILMLPLAIGIPLVSGRLLDSLPFNPVSSFRIVFALLGMLSFISIFFISRVNFSAVSILAPNVETKT